MSRAVVLGTAVLLAAIGPCAGQDAPTPFKLGTFERQGRPFVGIVLREAVVIDLAAAHATVRNPASRLAAPGDMKDLIARYDAGLRDRIREILRVVGNPSTGRRPAYVHDVSAVKVLPPIIYPDHDGERGRELSGARRRDGARPGRPTAVKRRRPPARPCPARSSAPGIWERASGDTRWNPYMFLKSAGAIVADGEPVRMPDGAHANRMGMRAGGRDRQVRQSRLSGAGPGPCLRLHPRERHVGPRRPRRHPVRQRLADHQEPRQALRRWDPSSRRRSSSKTWATWR